MTIRRSLIGAARFPGVAWSFSRLGFRRRAKRFEPTDLDLSLTRRGFVVTGANSGIGRAAALALAQRDADLWLLCRDPERGEAARAELSRVGRGTVRVEQVDMSDLSSIRQLLTRWSPDRVDALVHNAGALFDERVDVPPGVERTFALHVLGPELLSRGLLPALKGARGRVIYVSSGGMYAERLSVNALRDPPAPFDGVRAYARAKRAQVELAEMWARREPAVRFYAMHPGWAETAGVKTALPGLYRVTRRWLRTPAEGPTRSIVWLAACQTLTCPSGAFVFDRALAKRHLMPETTADDAERDRLARLIEEYLER